MKNESPSKILFMALGVCLVCAVMVSTSVVILKPIQKRNQEKDKLKNILSVGGLMVGDNDLQTIYQEHIRAKIIDLEKGIPVSSDSLPENLQPDRFDIKEISKSPEFIHPLNPDEDIAQIKQCPKVMIIYQVTEGDSIIRYILPVYGKGLWSTLYGFLALGSDLKTIEAFSVYEHGETPGLGGEVDNPHWKAQWTGKQAFDDLDTLKIEVIKGKIDINTPEAKYQVDGLSGSTLTTRGVNALVRFWLGEKGYGPYIAHLRADR